MTAVGTAFVITRADRTFWRTSDLAGRIVRAIRVGAIRGAVAVIVDGVITDFGLGATGRIVRAIRVGTIRVPVAVVVDSVVTTQFSGGRIAAILCAVELSLVSIADTVSTVWVGWRCTAVHGATVAVFGAFAAAVATAVATAFRWHSGALRTAAVTGSVRTTVVFTAAVTSGRFTGRYTSAIARTGSAVLTITCFADAITAYCPTE